MKYWRPVYYGLLAFWLIAGLGTGQRQFFLLFFSQLLLALSALGMNVWAAHSFRFQQTLSASQTVHGQPVHLQLHIYNEKILPYPLMNIQVATPVFNERKVLQFNLAAGSQIDFDLVLDCPYRGEYRVGMTVIDFIDIFNLVRFPFNMVRLPYYRVPELLVYPLMSRLGHAPLPVLLHKAVSRHHTATEDFSEPFSTVRNYRPGDAGKLIHWKASSRHQTLLTRQFEQSAEPRVQLVIDFQQPPWTGEAACQAQDALCESAAALLEYLLRQGLPLQLSSLGDPGPQSTASLQAESGDLGSHGLKDFQRFYKWLAAVPFAKPAVLPDEDATKSVLLMSKLSALAGDPAESMAILILTTQVDLALVPALVRLRQRNRTAIIIVAEPSQGTMAGSAEHLQLARQAAELQHQLNQLHLSSWLVHYGESLGDLMNRQQAPGLTPRQRSGAPDGNRVNHSAQPLFNQA